MTAITERGIPAMPRRLVSLALAAMLALSTAVPALAAPTRLEAPTPGARDGVSSPALPTTVRTDTGDAGDAGGAVTQGVPGQADIALQLVASGLTEPVYITESPDGSGRRFIVEQGGKIKILSGGTVFATSYLNISTLVSKGFEQGLLGLAFHPKFASNRLFYVNYTDVNGDTVIREYAQSTTNSNVASSYVRTILRINQPYANHNGGMLAFGPDGYLYIGMGDGGDTGDPGNRAQSISTLLGKMLRININGKAGGKQYLVPAGNPYVGKSGLDEIWQRGLRNPWRFSFDRLNGNLWIGDVGQRKWEEVDRAVRTSSGAGRGVNWGWRVMEGRHCYLPSTGCSTAGKTLPLTEYDHASGRCSISGGYVYRGSAIPVLVGGYLFADYCSGQIWVVNSTASAPASRTLLLDTSHTISSFGQDKAGELYVVNHGGTIYRIVQG